MNRKLLLYLTTATILLPLTSQAKQKTASPKNIALTSAVKSIEPSYFLQITVAENDCEKLLGQTCFFRDKLFSNPYSHETKLTIFLNKIFATQSFHDKTIITQVKDGSYSLTSNNGNLISFTTKNGTVSDLNLIKGDLAKETNQISKCNKAENLYNFYQIYNRDDAIFTRSGTYKDEYDFSGLNEYILFAEKDNQAEIMALSKDADQKITAIENTQLCRMKNSTALNVRHLNAEECTSDETAEECFKYKECEDEVIVDNCEVTLFKDGFN